MATNNVVNAPFPLSPTQGGTGVASPTQYQVSYSNGASAFTYAALTNGQLLIGSTGAAPIPATITAGTGVIVTNGANTITIAASGAGAFVWNNVSTTTQAMVANAGYYVTEASATTLTLPATAAAGTEIKVSGYGAGGWTIAQNASQEIFFGNQHTTAGTGGSLASTNQYDSVSILCTVANTDWVVTAAVGNLTVV